MNNHRSKCIFFAHQYLYRTESLVILFPASGGRGEYIYANGNGKLTDFGTIKCANAYAMIFENNAVEIIPVPFTKAETITIDLTKFPVKTGSTLVLLDKDRKEISRTAISGKMLKIAVDGKAFSYKITQ